MPEVALDPIVAALASSLEKKGKQATLPDAAVAACRAKLKAAPSSEKKRLAQDLMAWAIKLDRLAGKAALGPRIVCAELALELLGDEAAAADMFKSAGLGKEMTEAIGRARADVKMSVTDASKPASTAPVKAARGPAKKT